ncbi:hypothetical protein J6590_086297 [Homalodisca vitripennis]|nr:hypothetical protein J6590_086297 [Homalodisca vitripennis]
MVAQVVDTFLGTYHDFILVKMLRLSCETGSIREYGLGVVMNWRENNIKNEEQGGEEAAEDGIRKATFGSASACVRVRGKIF